MKKILALSLLPLVLTGCFDTDAKVASANLAKAADMFELDRRIVFYNTWKGEYLLSIEGRCSITNNGTRVAVTCKTGPSSFKIHYLGLSGNVTYVSEQLKPAVASVYRYKVIFKPSTIIPDIDVKI